MRANTYSWENILPWLFPRGCCSFATCSKRASLGGPGDAAGAGDIGFADTLGRIYCETQCNSQGKLFSKLCSMQGRSSAAAAVVLQMENQFASQKTAPGSGRWVSGGGSVMGAVEV